MHYEPKLCFCRYRVDELAELAKTKLIEHRSTIDMMESAKSDTERAEVAIISLFDVDDVTLRDVMEGKLEDGECNVVSCRRMLKRQIETLIDKEV
jgi:hypothetical protein